MSRKVKELENAVANEKKQSSALQAKIDLQASGLLSFIDFFNYLLFLSIY